MNARTRAPARVESGSARARERPRLVRLPEAAAVLASTHPGAVPTKTGELALRPHEAVALELVR